MRVATPQEHANSYDRFSGAWSELVGAQVLGRLTPSQGLDWLDLGCGTGRLTELLQRDARPRSLFGLDASEASIRLARRRSVGKFAQFSEGIPADLPFGAGCFDAVSVGLGLCRWPELQRAMEEIWRVLRPGGFALAYEWDITAGGHPLAALHRVIAAASLKMEYPPSAAICSALGLQSLWEQAKFRDVRAEQIDVQLQFSDFDALWAFAQDCDCASSVLHNCTPAQTRDIGEALRASLGALPGQSWALSGKAWMVIGTR